MDRLIYLSMTGAKATHAAPGHARATTSPTSRPPAFAPSWRRSAPCRCEGSGASTRVYALESTPGYDATPGPVSSTGRNLDVAMKGNAWLAVQALDGTEAYTRGGSLDVDADGKLVTRSGLPVLGDGGPIQVPPNTRGQHRRRRHRQRHAPATASSTAIGKLKLVTPEAPLTRGTTACSAPPTATSPADADRARAGRRARRPQRQRGRGDGRDDRRRAPVRDADEDAADRRKQREARQRSCSAERQLIARTASEHSQEHPP